MHIAYIYSEAVFVRVKSPNYFIINNLLPFLKKQTYD